MDTKITVTVSTTTDRVLDVMDAATGKVALDLQVDEVRRPHGADVPLDERLVTFRFNVRDGRDKSTAWSELEDVVGRLQAMS